MTSHAPKENGTLDAMQLVEASDGLHEFVPEHAGQSRLLPREVRRARVDRVQEPLLLWPGEAAGPQKLDAAPALIAAPVGKPELTLDVGLDAGWGDPARIGWARLAGGAAVVAVLLSAAAAGVLMLRTSPTPSLASLPAPAMGTPEPDASPLAPPAARDPLFDRAVAPDRRTPLVPVEPAMASPGSGGATSTVPQVATMATRTLAMAAGDQPAEPLVAKLRPETDLRTPPSARVEELAASPVPESPPSTIAAPSPAPPPAVGASRLPDPPRAASVDAPVAAVAPRSSRDVDTRAIELVLGQYRSAFNRLDANSASAVWPSVDEKSLARAFERIENQNLSFDNCEIEVGGVDAQANCRGTARYVPKVGSRAPRDDARRWRFSLRRTGDGWIIDQVTAR